MLRTSFACRDLFPFRMGPLSFGCIRSRAHQVRRALVTPRAGYTRSTACRMDIGRSSLFIYPSVCADGWGAERKRVRPARCVGCRSPLSGFDGSRARAFVDRPGCLWQTHQRVHTRLHAFLILREFDAFRQSPSFFRNFSTAASGISSEGPAPPHHSASRPRTQAITRWASAFNAPRALPVDAQCCGPRLLRGRGVDRRPRRDVPRPASHQKRVLHEGRRDLSRRLSHALPDDQTSTTRATSRRSTKKRQEAEKF